MLIQQYYPIRDKHSFHIEVTARYWAEYDHVEELQAILRDASDFGLPILPIGGGCNLLFQGDYAGILLHSRMQEVEIVEENDKEVLIVVGAGKNWDELVDFTVKNGWGGMQNLSGIPGTVGATPVQNIGAYGVEVKELIQKVEVLDRASLETIVLDAKDCRLSYRNSRFKQDWKDRYIVTRVWYRLSKQPVYQLSYGLLKQTVESMGALGVSVKENLGKIREAVLKIRNEKLPCPDKIGNAGSFFMNPVVEKSYYEKYIKLYPEMPSWMLEEGKVKLSAAWMIEQCGFKGKRIGDAGVYDKQALVLVNYGQAKAKDIMDLFDQICEAVYQRFELKLSPEVIIVR